MKLLSWSAAALAFASAASPVMASENPGERAPALRKVVECRSVQDRDARLACYDREVAELDGAEARKDVVVVDRAQIQKTKRTLFGLKLPQIALFDREGDPEKEQIKRIDTTISTIGVGSDGKVVFTVADGAVWRQADSYVLAGRLESGGKVTIVRNAIGSFFARMEGRPGFRVERLNR